MKTVQLKPHVDMSEVDEYIRKVDELNQKLKEAKSLAGELASIELNLVISAETEISDDRTGNTRQAQ